MELRGQEVERATGIETLDFLGSSANCHLTTLRVSEIGRYRDDLAARLASGTVNTHLKVLRVCLEDAVRQNIFNKNPARMVKNLDRPDKHRRRPFTLPELKKLIEIASADWKTMTLIGLYTGLRLQDCANLTALNLNFAEAELTLTGISAGLAVTQETRRQTRQSAVPESAHD